VTVRPRRIGHIGLVSTDLERLVAWYEDVLGFQVSDRMPYPEDHAYYEGVWMRCNTDHHVVSLFGLRAAQPPAPPELRELAAPGFHHVAFEMESFADLRRIARYARDHDIPIAGMRTDDRDQQRLLDDLRALSDTRSDFATACASRRSGR